MTADTELELMVRQLDYLIAKLGEDHVGFGSDFDGATVPAKIGSAAGLPVLIETLAAKRYSEPLLNRNWVRPTGSMCCSERSGEVVVIRHCERSEAIQSS